jgi:chitinase
MPLYGRSFAQTSGPGAPFVGVGGGSWENGVYDYRALPQPGAEVVHNASLMASWSYDAGKREMVSFDSAEVGRWKGTWIREQGLRGSMFWELAGDKNEDGPARDRSQDMERGPGKEEVPGRSLVRVVKEAMGPLDRSPNWLRYEASQFDNMRKGMP